MENDFLKLIVEQFHIDENRPEEVAPILLAYIGDCVYDMVIRTLVLSKGNRAVNLVNKEAISFVNAGTQAKLADALMDSFSETEENQYKRGRNAKSNTSAKNASIRDYRKATGFEAVMGYLYLKGDVSRVVELCKIGLEKCDLWK